MQREQEWNLHGKCRWLAVLTAVLVFFCAQALAAVSYPFNTVTSDKVNMRRSASSTSVVLERLEKGDAIEVLGASGSYYKISYNNRTGYVLKQYVVTEGGSVTTPTPVPVETVSGYPYDTTANDSVNLRASQSVHSELLKQIPQGATVTVESVSTNGTFAKVVYNGVEGYCKKEFLNLKKVVKATATPTAGPTLSPEESASGYTVLQKGDTGSSVSAMQSALIELGFLSGSADGKFGGGTEAAVIAFQEKNGYPTTGVVDANLQAFLYSGTPLNSKGKKTSVMTLAPVSGVTIRLNNTGELVSTVQTRLTELGYYTGTVSGVYDSATKKACAAFQKKNGLTADGLCGAATQNALLGASALSAAATPTPTPTATPTPVPTFTTPEATVRSGSTGNDAKLVQKRLKELGYLSGSADGKFGVSSVKALTAFQEKNGLKADGVAGSGTYAVLFSISAVSANQTPTPAPTAIPTPAPATPTPTPLTEANCVLVMLGTEGDVVKTLQARLTALGYYTATVDGVCKADDVAAIKTFQEKNGLKVDGKAGYGTQSKLYSASAVMYTGAIAGGTVDSFTTLRKGMSGDAVTAMQSRLIELGYLTGQADGKYGTATAAAVIAFQKKSGLIRDGVAGSATLTKLYSQTAVTPAPSASATPSASGLTANGSLIQGSAGDAVKEMQTRLIELGYLSGKADGKFGVQTYLALTAFQQANHLTSDGIAGSKTLSKLTSSSVVSAGGSTATATATPSTTTTGSASYKPTASAVRYANWYTEVKARCKLYPYATVYDFTTGISWQVHMFSLGAHADSEPLTAADTAKMEKAFGGNTWNPKAVWVIFGDGRIYMASTHSMPHEVQHIKDNNFPGHLCIHFPRTSAQVTAIGPYATSHQKAIDAGWAATQALIK